MISKARHALAMVSLVLASPASAASVILTFNGTLEDGADPVSMFGLGPNYSNVGFSLEYRFDDAVPGSEVFLTPFKHTIGGLGPAACDGCFGSPGTAVLTISGVSRSIGSAHGSRVEKSTVPGLYDYLAADVLDRVGASGTESAFANFVGADLFDSINLFDPFTYTRKPPTGGGETDPLNDFGEIIYTYAPSQPLAPLYGARGFALAESLTPFMLRGSITSFSVGPALATVPEPAAWGMMILGFGMIGATSRKRKMTHSLPRI